MGIQDRDYYREDNRWSNPFARSQATLFLCLLYAFIYVGQIATREEARPFAPARDGITEVFQLDVEKTTKGEVWRLITHALVHDPWNPFHIVITGIFLIWIGHQIEDIYGWKEYLAYFGLTTVLGGIAYTAVAAIAGGDQLPILLGPSGAVTAILVLFALHYPHRTIHLFFFLPIPIWLFVLGYAFVDVVGLTTHNADPARVAVHLAGAAFALVYHNYSLRVLNWLPGRRESRRHVRRQSAPKFRAAREQPEPAPAAATRSAAGAPAKAAAPTSSVDEHLEAKLDQVLEKVQKYGKESLTETEREILLKASEIYKKRRQSS
jgi:rhomboid family protein